jgi:adenylate cyclase
VVQHYLSAVFAVGMALAFWTADRRSPTSIALAAALGSLGVSIAFQVMLFDPRLTDLLLPWSAPMAIFEGLTIAAVLEWLLRLRRTLPSRAGVNIRFGDRALRLGQLSALIYVICSFAAPELRFTTFLQAYDQHGWAFAAQPGFWLFAAPILASTLFGLVGVVLLLRRRPDRAEGVRLIAMTIATPFLIAGFVLPSDYAAMSIVLGEVSFLVGAVHYHVLQGQRGQFMSRFLSPQVARLVAERGLDRAMQENQLEISVIACDLRGFTAYAGAVESKQVLRVLREYYDAVGRVVGMFGGTIKDYAGDGILILVGAPLPIEHHARCAVEMARQIRQETRRLIANWNVPGHPLGIGIGVGTGVVTVGVIGAASRLEYTAVGSTVNLAARLCAGAADGEILVDQRTVAYVGETGLSVRAPVRVKGITEPVPHFALFAEQRTIESVSG